MKTTAVEAMEMKRRRHVRAQRLVGFVMETLRPYIEPKDARYMARALFEAAFGKRLMLLEIPPEQDALEEAQIRAAMIEAMLANPPRILKSDKTL